jgi:orotate phosphoribosyltransferase
MDIMHELERAGAVLLDKHFVYASGKHGSGYINMDPLFPRVQLVEDIGQQLVRWFHSRWVEYNEHDVDTVAGPATGGILLAYAAAKAWYRSYGPPPAAIWADKDGDDFVFERAGFANHLKDKKVLVVEDLLTTGGSVAKVCREVERQGGEIVGVSVVCNRGGLTAEDLGVPRLESLASVSFEAIEADQCPLCERDIPIIEDVGHGAKFKQEHPDYVGGYTKLLS